MKDGISDLTNFVYNNRSNADVGIVRYSSLNGYKKNCGTHHANVTGTYCPDIIIENG